MNRKKRIAILGDFPIGNVSERYARRESFYASWLYNLFLSFCHSDDYEIHWILVDKNIKKDDDFIVNNQWFHLRPGARLTVGLYTGYIYDRWQVRRCVKKIQPDIFHGWGTERFYGLAAKDFKGKSILSVQGLLNACSRRVRLSPFEQKHKLYELPVLRNVDYITTESPWARDRVLEDVPDADVTICEYAVEQRFFNIERRPEEHPSCLISCNNSPVKNVKIAVKAFSRNELRHVKLYMAGIEPGVFPDLPENIIPLGRVNRDRITELLSTTWCLVHPSLADTGPTAVKEARAAGVATVLTTECGAQRYVVDGKSGFIIPPHDEQALVDAVLRVTASRENAYSMGLFDLDSCRNSLCADKMFRSFSQLYSRILAN